MKNIVVGLDVGGTSIKAGLFEGNRLVLREKRATPKQQGAQGVLDHLTQTVWRLLEKAGAQREDLRGVGLGVPGPVRGGVCLRAVNLGWENLPVAKLLQEGMDCPVLIANDANLAALGEASAMERAPKNMVLVTLGTGIGAGLLQNGRILEGRHGLAGELGHMIMVPHGRRCTCGRSGCLEMYSSGRGLAQNYSELKGEPMEVKDLMGPTNPLRQKALDKGARMLAQALANVANVVDPEVFVLGGGVMEGFPELLFMVRTHYERFALLKAKEIPVIRAQLGNEAGLYGALELVLKNTPGPQRFPGRPPIKRSRHKAGAAKRRSREPSSPPRPTD
ncbi:Glucokinase [Clostridiaceae bacterium JG1575]|nr:Glucokinase [Clostridiaceae bacterium JG1575]